MNRSGVAGLSSALAIIYLISAALASAPQEAAPARDCDERWARLFAPLRPQLGEYRVCADPLPLARIVPTGWPIEATGALDAFGAAGGYDRARLSRLYGGVRPSVARGSVEHPNALESLTLISPHPDPTLSQLVPGTLVISHLVPR